MNKSEQYRFWFKVEEQVKMARLVASLLFVVAAVAVMLVINFNSKFDL